MSSDVYTDVYTKVFLYTKEQGPGSVIAFSDLAWSCLDVETAKLSEVTEIREVFRDLLGLLPPTILRHVSSSGVS